MEEKITTSKIVVEESNELTDLVRNIHKSKADRIVLTFTEPSDILISPINLKVLLETAQRENKLLVAQIIQNPTGIRNAKLAGLKAVDTPSNPTEYEWEEAEELILEKKKEKLERKKFVERATVKEEEKEIFEEPERNSVEEPKPEPRVEIKKENSSEYLDKRGIRNSSFISIDQDIPTATKEESVKNEESPVPIATPTRTKRFNFKSNLLKKAASVNKKKLLKIFLIIFVPLLLLLLISGLLYNRFGTFVKVKIFVESKSVEVDAILTGDTNRDEIDFENSKIPIKREEKSKSLSETIIATGKKYDGENAKGEIRIIYFKDCPEENTESLKIPAGTNVTSSGGKNYKLKNAVTVGCETLDVSGVQIEASTYGPEYNLSTTNNAFTIQGYSSSDINVRNTSPITGGTKVEFTVLSQVDIDNGVEALSTTAIEEVKSELRDISGDWKIIEDSILSSVDKATIKTDKQVGEEATNVNLDLTIKGTATYYNTDGLIDKLKELLTSKAEKENLFESDKDMELELSEDIETKVTVEEVKESSVKIKIVARANIKPKIEKDKIIEELVDLKWDDGKNYLNSLNFAEKKPEATFNPNWYPAFLKKFPTRNGGILIEIKEVEITEKGE